MTTAAGAAQATVTEEDLIKTLNLVQGKTEVAPQPGLPKVATAQVATTAAAHVRAAGSEELKKAIDVSKVLREVVDLIGDHVDESIGTLSKSIVSGAERDVAIIETLVSLKKSIDANTAALVELQKQPSARPLSKSATSAAAGGTTTVEVLNKGADQQGGGQGGELPASGTPEGERLAKSTKAIVVRGLDALIKSNTKDGVPTPEGQRYAKALVKFDSTGVITDQDLHAAKSAVKQ